MKAKSGSSIQLRIMFCTFIALAASCVTDLLLLFSCLRTGFLVIRQHESTQEEAARPIDHLLAQHDLSYRIFGVQITSQLIGLLIVTAIVVFLVVFYLLSRRMTGYIQTIETDVRKMADGDFGIRLRTDYGGELSVITSSINQLAENVEIMKKKADEAELTKNELITDVAHDLRTPLTSIIGYIDLVNKGGQTLSEEQKAKYLDIAFVKAEKLNHLIDELFDLTKTRYGQMPMQLETIDLVSLISQTVDEFYPVFEEHHLTCRMETEVDKCMVAADGEKLFRVFDNLLSNAVRYGSDGKKINIRINAGHDNVTVHVINYGNIIPEESIPKLFEKFYKVDTARTGAAGGTGLGLAIAKSIVESHGGTIGVTSGFNGTDFCVTLPLSASVKEG